MMPGAPRTRLHIVISLMMVEASVTVHQTTAPTDSNAIPGRKPDLLHPGTADAQPRSWKDPFQTHAFSSNGDEFPENDC